MWMRWGYSIYIGFPFRTDSRNTQTVSNASNSEDKSNVFKIEELLQACTTNHKTFSAPKESNISDDPKTLLSVISIYYFLHLNAPHPSLSRIKTNSKLEEELLILSSQ